MHHIAINCLVYAQLRNRSLNLLWTQWNSKARQKINCSVNQLSGRFRGKPSRRQFIGLMQPSFKSVRRMNFILRSDALLFCLARYCLDRSCGTKMEFTLEERDVCSIPDHQFKTGDSGVVPLVSGSFLILLPQVPWNQLTSSRSQKGINGRSYNAA